MTENEFFSFNNAILKIETKKFSRSIIRASYFVSSLTDQRTKQEMALIVSVAEELNEQIKNLQSAIQRTNDL